MEKIILKTLLAALLVSSAANSIPKAADNAESITANAMLENDLGFFHVYDAAQEYANELYDSGNWGENTKITVEECERSDKLGISRKRHRYRLSNKT